MAKRTASTSLTDRIDQLLAQRQEHADAITEIDHTLSQISRLLGTPINGLSTVAAPAAEPAEKGRGGRGKGRGGKRRGRGKYEMTAEDSILAFVKEKGNPTTKDIKAHWAEDGRRGTADNELSRLVRVKKLKRTPIPGQRGSRYTLA